MPTLYSQDVEKEWWIDTGVDDPDFNNLTINQRYGALLKFGTSTVTSQTGYVSSPMCSIYTDCVPVLRTFMYPTGSPNISVASPRIWIRARISIRNVMTTTKVSKIRLENYSWSLFKL